MEQNENPYSSPLTSQASTRVDAPSLGRRVSFVFLVGDLALIALLAVATTLLYAFAATAWSDWVVAIVFFYLPFGFTTVAFILLMREHNTGLPAAYLAGGYGVLIAIAALMIPVWLGTANPFTLLVLVRAVWNAIYISAAKSFTKK